VLAEHDGKTYVIWNGQRSVDRSVQQAVALALGVTRIPHRRGDLDAAVRRTACDRAAELACDSWRGRPSQFNVARDAVVGSVLSVRDLQTDADNVLCAAAQRCPAHLAVRRVAADGRPTPSATNYPSSWRRTGWPVSRSSTRCRSTTTPPTRLDLVDTASNPVTA
jgi:hypothetical protein